MPTYDNARFAVLVGAYQGRETLVLKERTCGRCIRAVAFDPRLAAFGEVLRQFRCDATDDVESIFSGEEGECRLIVGNARGEHAPEGNVGRIRGDDIKLHIFKRLEKIADAHECSRCVQIIFANIFQNSRLMRRVDFAEIHLRTWQFCECRTTDRAAPCAEVEKL